MNRATYRVSIALTAFAWMLSGSAFAQEPLAIYRTSQNLGGSYRDMGTTVAQINTVKKIPILNLDAQQRAARFSDYGSAIKNGKYQQAASSVGQDFGSGLVRDVSTIFLTDVLTRVARGEEMNTAVASSVKGMSSKEFLLGNIAGGTTGAALGSMISVPMLPGLAGSMAGTMPMLAGAMLGTRVSVNLINGRKPLAGIDPLVFIGQALGSSAGMVLGGLVPVPTLGPIVGGTMGGTAGVQAAEWLKEKASHINPKAEAMGIADMTADDAGSKSNGASLAGSDRAGPAAPGQTSPEETSQGEDPHRLDLASLRSRSDSLYRAYVDSSRGGDLAAATSNLTAYARVQGELATRK